MLIDSKITLMTLNSGCVCKYKIKQIFLYKKSSKNNILVFNFHALYSLNLINCIKWGQYSYLNYCIHN